MVYYQEIRPSDWAARCYACGEEIPCEEYECDNCQAIVCPSCIKPPDQGCAVCCGPDKHPEYL